MLRRLGFAGRLFAIVFLSLLALWLVGAGWAYYSRSTGRPRTFLPFPRQIAAIVALLDTTAAEHRDAVLAAVNSDVLTVRLAKSPPVRASDQSRKPGLEWLVTLPDERLRGRDIQASIGEAPIADKLPLGISLPAFGRSLNLSVSLNSGEYVVFEARGEISRRLFGLPPGFWIGILGALIGIAAIVAIAREAKPLAELANAVARFGDEGTPISLKARGAPDIVKLIEAINDMQNRISALVKGRTMFFGAVSHDLKTYITRLRLRAETIDGEDQRTRAVRDLDEMTTLIDDALAVARSSIVSERHEIVHLVALLSDEIERRQGEPITLLFPESNTDLKVSGDFLALRRLFTNLIDNALRFGKICQISLDRTRDITVIHVDDNGPGIPEAERLAVLEPFYRLETSRNRATGGSGLGLAIAREIVVAHNGAIAIETSPLGGARVSVRFRPTT